MPDPKGKMPVAEAVRLGEFVDYAAGSVVSRTILHRGVGNITLFSFDRGQELSEHTAPFDAFVQILDGRAEIIVGGKPIPASAGDAVIMPANIPHSLKAVERFKMLLTMIRE